MRHWSQRHPLLPTGSSLLAHPSVSCRWAVTSGSQNSDFDPITDVWPRRPLGCLNILPSAFRGAEPSSPQASPAVHLLSLGTPLLSPSPDMLVPPSVLSPPLSPSPSASVGNVICSDGFGHHPRADDPQIHRSLPSNG